MNRVGFGLLSGGVLAAMAGCASTEREPRTVFFGPPAEQRPAELATALLFDAHPGRFEAEQFAVRSDWPSADAFYSPGQVIYFSERFVDYQGRPFDESLGTYRRAESVKLGVGYR